MADWKALSKIKCGSRSVKNILERHMQWQNEKIENIDKKGYIDYITLQDIDFTDIDLEYFCFSRITFINVDFGNCTFYRCDFDNCNFVNCKFVYAVFRNCVFSVCAFNELSFKDTDFHECFIDDCDFRYVDFSSTEDYLTSGGFIFNTDCRFNDVSNLPYIPMACPETGSFIGYKKADGIVNGASKCPVIVVLEIPETAKRSSAFGRKCRCSEAKVLRIETLDGKIVDSSVKAESTWCMGFFYEVGSTVKPIDMFDPDRFYECSSGIHFFLNRQEAVNY